MATFLMISSKLNNINKTSGRPTMYCNLTRLGEQQYVGTVMGLWGMR